MQYDYLIVGSGLFGAVFARQALDAGKKCMIIEKRSHAGGNVYCEEINGIHVHTYGPHIFHTSNLKVWNYVNHYAEFNRYTNSPLANYKGELFNLPFNMNTFNRMWKINTPQEALDIINKQRMIIDHEPTNLEEQAISLVGTDIYKKLIKGYTEKQWGKECKDLPAFIIKRLPVRYTYDNNYFYDRFQGIPVGGYNALINELIDGADLQLNTDFNSNKEAYRKLADKIVYTGTLDSYFDYCFGKLEYRSLKFENEIKDIPNYQGVAVMNFTDRETPYTRIIEHKHFEFGKQTSTIITKEYPVEWHEGMEPYYPVNNQQNQNLYNQYALLAHQEHNFVYGGRLAEYKYYDMDKVVSSALALSEMELSHVD